MSSRIMPNKSLQSSMIITPSLRWLNMRLLSSLPTSPISDSLIQFLTYFKEKLCLLYSLEEESDKIPQTTCITFLQQVVKSIPYIQQVCIMGTAYHHNIAVNSAAKHHRAYTHLTHMDDNFGMISTDTELDHIEDDIDTIS